MRYAASYSVAGTNLSPRLRDITFTLSYDYAETESNFADYENDRTSLGLNLAYARSF